MRKNRSAPERIKRKTILIVTDDKNLSTEKLYRDFHLCHEEITIRIAKTDLTGKARDRAIKRYMKDHQIFTTQGDLVIYLNKNEKGGDAYDWHEK